MKAPKSTLAFGLLLSVAIPTGAALAADPGEQILLARANYWRAQHRPDLASDFLNKLLTLNPSQPDALYQQATLALEQGRRGDAGQYLDRLRMLAPADSRAAELATALAQPGAPVPRAPAPAAAAATTVSVALATPVVPAKPAIPAASPQPAPILVAVSADSDDLIPAMPALPTRPAPQPRAVALGEPPRMRQMASLPSVTISDSDPEIPASPLAVRAAGSTDLGTTAKTMQVAQVELEPPPPINGYQRLSVTYSPDDTLEQQIDRTLQIIEGATNPTLIAGFGFRGHSGDDGLNRLNEVGVNVEGSFSPWYTGTARLAILPVHLDANGSVSTSNINQFGASPLLSASGAIVPGSGDQHANGVGILASYSYSDFSGQFGTSPLGFPVVNLLGNLAYTPKFLDNTLSVRIEALRQPVTDTVLSYAGRRANLASANILTGGAFGSNSIWGGVVKTGGHATVFYDDQMYGAYAGAGLASLTGQSVADNDVLDAMAGAYFRPWKTEDWAIRVGVSSYYTHYNKNLGGFTFGQGGYFSPQNYIAVTFPVEYIGHRDAWSWLAAAAIGVQHFNSDSSLTFPRNLAAQAILASIPGSQTTFGGTTETGPAFNVKGQIEYAIDNSLSVGASASLDNANNYVEGIGKIYLRKTFDWLAPIAKSDAPSIVARDQPMSRL